MKTMPPDPLKITVIGAGVIGSSWAALFLAHGHAVIVNDPDPDVQAVLDDALAQIAPTLRRLGLPTDDLAARLSVDADLEAAVAGADIVQENGPERVDFKRALWARVEAAAPSTALLLSSSSAIPATAQAKTMTDASRLLVGHPFNPPHLLPLVEVVPGRDTSEAAVAEAVAFFASLGKTPRVLHKEIGGFVANRLQRAIFRESCYLVLEGVVDVAELDDIVTSSLGLRWAVNGPFSSFDLGGGPDGLAGFFAKFGDDLNRAWREQPALDLDTAARERIAAQAQSAFGGGSRADAEAARDAGQLAILRALAELAGD
jgi:ketoreductase RED1